MHASCLWGRAVCKVDDMSVIPDSSCGDGRCGWQGFQWRACAPEEASLCRDCTARGTSSGSWPPCCTMACVAGSASAAVASLRHQMMLSNIVRLNIGSLQNNMRQNNSFLKSLVETLDIRPCLCLMTWLYVTVLAVSQLSRT